MNNLTKFKILKSANEVFEAFVDPLQIGNFWFSSSSERWAQGKTIILKYDLYNAEGEMKVVEIVENKKIVFQWGSPDEETLVTILLNELDSRSTMIEIKEEGFNVNDEDIMNILIGNKEGWVFMLTCLKAYLEFGITELRGGLLN